MPSPIGHVLGGLAAGWLVAGRSTAAPREVRARTSWWAHAREPHAALFGAIGAAPDIDLLFGTHSTYTHSVGAVAGTAVAVLLWTRGRQPRLAAACAAAVASHVLLDWLGSDYDAAAWRNGPVAVHARVLPVALLSLHGHLAPMVAARVLHAERGGRTAGAGHSHTDRRPHRSCSSASRGHALIGV